MDHTARQITAGAAIMIAVFGSLLVADVLELKQFGFGLSMDVPTGGCPAGCGA